MPTETTNKPQPTITRETWMLLSIAARLPVLQRKMRLEEDEQGNITILNTNQPWLSPHPVRPTELTFDPDQFAKNLKLYSSGERHCMLFLLNVWNPGYAKDQGWKFNLFEALHTLDYENIHGIAEWMKHQIWP